MEEIKIDPNVKNIAESHKDLKIALIGFYTFKNRLVEVKGRSRTYQAFLDYNNSTKEYFIYGKPIEKYSTNGNNNEVSSEAVKKLVRDFLESVSESGLNEMNKLVEFNRVDSIINFSLRKRDVDYYIVGIHGPPYQNEISKEIKKIISIAPFIFTLGCFPYWDEVTTESNFRIYDNKLKLIKNLNYKNKYNILISWFGAENYIDIETKRFYKPDINHLTNELFNTISTVKNNE